MSRTKITSAQTVSGVLGYMQITSSVSATTTNVATGLTLTVTTPNLVGNQRVEIEMYCRDAFTSGGGILDIILWDGIIGSGTQLQVAEPNTPSGSAVPVLLKWSGTPTAGSHTFAIGLNKVGGTQANLEAAATYPAWLQVKVV